MISVFICLTILLASSENCLAKRTEQIFYLSHDNDIFRMDFMLEKKNRLTFSWYYGNSEAEVYVNQSFFAKISQSMNQLTLPEEMISQKITIKITGSTSSGLVVRQIYEKIEILEHGQEKIINLQAGSQRVIEIYPNLQSFQTLLIIERFQGIPIFFNNRCKKHEKMDCLNRLERLEPIKMIQNYEAISLDQCTDCLFLLKIKTQSQMVKIRLSIDSALSILAQFPTAVILRKGEQKSFLVNGQSAQRGKIVHYSGRSSLSQLQTEVFDNGYFYSLPNDHNSSNPCLISIVGLEDLNYILVEAPSDESHIRLRSGYPTTIYFEPKMNYIIQFWQSTEARANLDIRSHHILMNNIGIRLYNQNSVQYYEIKSTYFYTIPIVSQNVQLSNYSGLMKLQLTNLANFGGYFNISLDLGEVIYLLTERKHSSILQHGQLDQYLVEGEIGLLIISITKCLQCQLEVAAGQLGENLIMNKIEGREWIDNFITTTKPIFIKVRTNNYAFYSILVSKQIFSKPVINNKQVQLTLVGSQGYSLQFQRPKCGQTYCQNVKYHLFQGQNSLQVSSQAYCPDIRFDLNQSAQDVIEEFLNLEVVDEKRMTFTKYSAKKPWILISAEIDGEVLSYNILNYEQQRQYSNILESSIYVLLFLFLALVGSYAIFNVLGKKVIKKSQKLYVREDDTSSLQSFA